MRSAFFAVTFGVLAVATSFAQGTIIFANRDIPTISGTGGANGNGTYNVPIWYPENFPFLGAGSMAGGATVGLCNSDGALIASTRLGTNEASSMFFAEPSQVVTVPGHDAGTTAVLIVRVWQGSGTFASAKTNGFVYAEYSFQTKPLGGTPIDGGASYDDRVGP